MTLADYRASLIERETAQQCYARVSARRCGDHPLLPGTSAALVWRSARQAARTAPDGRSGIQLSKLDAVRPCR